ncbi:MAG: transcription termination factor NusA, partial [Abditibacteriaceae bacterium]
RSVAEEKGIPQDALVASIEGALVSAYKKAFGGTGTVRISADFEANNFRVFAQKLGVQRALNPNTEVSWKDAKIDTPEINLGEIIEREVTPDGFGRIAAQTAKQVLLQNLRDAEREQVVSEYQDRMGEMFRGVVQRTERRNVILSIGKAEAILPVREQTPGEGYRFGDAIFVYVTDVRPSQQGPSIIVSRTHPGLVRQLFTREVPEIKEGIVELKSVAREAGQRTKIAVVADNPEVDPVGACVGPRGMRVSDVVAELGNEKVDIVRWNEDPIQYISNALSPAQISKVILSEDEEPADSRDKGTATVIVTEEQQSLAIGKQGQNVRLAARLTGWRIDIRTEKQYAEEQAKQLLSGERANANKVVRESPDALAGIFQVNGEDETVAEAKAEETPAEVDEKLFEVNAEQDADASLEEAETTEAGRTPGDAPGESSAS